MSNATNNQTLPAINQQILHALLFTPTSDGWGYPGFLWGDPGVGKTKLVQSVAKRHNLPYVRLSPAERGEGQFGVVPVPQATDKGLRLQYPAPAFTDDLTDGGLIFIDEFNLGGYALQAPMLGLVQLRTLGDHTFNNRVRVLAAANQSSDAPGAHDLANSVANRFAHFRCEGLDAEGWAAGLLIGFKFGDNVSTRERSARDEENRVLAAWPQAYATAAATVAGFITRRPDLLHVKPARGSKALAWPSRRAWEAATLALASSTVHNLSDADTDAFLSAILGIDAVSEFATFRANLDLPNTVDLLDGRVSWKHDPNRPDRTNIVLGSAAAFLHGSQPDAARTVRAERAWELIGSVLDNAADLVVPAAETLFAARLTYPTVQSAAARKVQARLKPVTDGIKAIAS